MNIVQKQISAIKRMQKYLVAQYMRTSDIEEIGLPNKENTQLRIITTKQINAIVFILHLIQNFGCIDELILSYFSIGIKTIKTLDMLMQEGSIDKIYLQTSTLRMIGKEKHILELLKKMKKKYGDKRFSGNLAWIHTKIMCIRVGGRYYVLEGSGNMSSNAKIEQYLFEKSKQSFNFHSEWIKNVEDFSTDKEVYYI
jgi:hypothetical protein